MQVKYTLVKKDEVTASGRNSEHPRHRQYPCFTGGDSSDIKTISPEELKIWRSNNFGNTYHLLFKTRP